MDPRLLHYYNRELQHAKEMGGEFAQEFPKVAGRLGLEKLECADPYVERLLEGFAFMAARVQLKLDAEYPRFTQHLFEMVYPHYLSPVPSMMVVQFRPDLSDPGLADGVSLPRDTILRGVTAKGERTACEYRTANEVTLWPIELTEVRYFPSVGSLANINVEASKKARAGIRLSLRCTSAAFDEMAIERLPLFLTGGGDVPKQLYEQLLGNCSEIVVRPKGGSNPWTVRLPKESVRRYGFDEDQNLLPYTRRSFEGYRLLQEYFAFPERFLFVELAGLAPAIKRCAGTELEIFILLDRSISWLESAVDKSHFSLYSAAAINLFPKRADRINVDRGKTEFHILPDRTRPLDFEVHSLESVKGFAGTTESTQDFLPFYTARDPAHDPDERSYYTLRRDPRVLSSKLRREGTRSSYVGSEVFLSLVDGREAPFSPDLKQLELKTLCTNRDLPLQMTLGTASSDFSLDVGAPVESVQRIAGPTPPRPSPVLRESPWRLLNHLSLNYISLVQEDNTAGAETIRQMLSLYADVNDTTIQKQIEGVKSINSNPIIRRMPGHELVTFGRGLEISLTCEDAAFEGTGAFLLGCVMEEFFTRYVSLNSFTETVLRTIERGEVMRWPARIGRRHRL